MSDSVALQAWRGRARGAGERRRRPSAKAVAGAAAALCCVVVGGRAVGGTDTSARTTPAAPAAPAPLCPAVATALHADVDGDGCDDEVAFADGVLSAGPLHMRVGAPGDQLALGRWTCGPVTVALLRPATGEVFRFDGWATQDTSVAAVSLGRIDGAVGVSAAPRPGGRCDDIAVARTSGPPILLPDRPVAG